MYIIYIYIEYKIHIENIKYVVSIQKKHIIKLCLYNLYKYVCDIDKNKILYSNLFAC